MLVAGTRLGRLARARRGAGIRAGRDGDPARRNASAAAGPEPRLRLHTISFSHYTEKVRWCLDRLGVPYDEVPNVGILGVLVTGRTVPLLEVPPGLTRIGDSPRILRYLWGEYAGRLPFERTAFLEPTPATLELEQYFDRRLGNDVRVWVYARVFERRDLMLRTWGIEETRIPAWQRTLLKMIRAGVALRRATHARCVTVACREGAGTHARVVRPGGRDAGRRSTLPDGRDADVRRPHVREPRGAGRAASRVCGPQPGGRRLSLDDVDAEWRAAVEEFRARPAGQFVLRLYREERLKDSPSRADATGHAAHSSGSILLRAPLAPVLVLGRGTHAGVPVRQQQ